MSYVTGFDTDIFISYSHLDNQALTGAIPMITTLHTDLQKRVSQVLGEEVTMWRDCRLQGNDYLDEAIEAALKRSAVLVSVMSPRYCQSKWCLRELKGFLRKADEPGEIRLGTRSRLFKVVKTPVALPEQPHEVKMLIGYDFVDAEGRELLLQATDEALRAYRTKVDDLAHDIHLALKQMNGAGPPAPRQTIYLAETSSDLSETREELKREFVDKGYRILPDRSLPLKADELKTELKRYLGMSHLSLHLIGRHYGLIPEGETRSTVWIQHDEAAECQEGGQLKRIIWLRPDLTECEDPQRQRLSQLDAHLQSKGDFELLKTSVEGVKTFVLDKLTERERPSPPPDPVEGDPTRLYIVCERVDFDAVRPIRSSLLDCGFEVILPLRAGDQAEIRNDHEDNLRFCDGILIYHGAGSERWRREKQNDLLRARAQGRSKPYVARCMYLGPAATEDKKEFESREFIVVRNFSGFDPNSLQPFIERLSRAQGRSA